MWRLLHAQTSLAPMDSTARNREEAGKDGAFPLEDQLQPSAGVPAGVKRPPEVVAPRSVDEPEVRTPRSSSFHAFAAKHSSSTLSVLGAAAVSIKGKTQQVAQQQKRALSAFQQKGGLVSWLHGEDESDERRRTTEPSAATTTVLHDGLDNEVLSNRDSSARSPVESRLAANRGRRRSVPTVGSAFMLDSLLDKVVGATPPSSPRHNHRIEALRPTVVAEKTARVRHAENSVYRSMLERQRAATIGNGLGGEDSSPPELVKSWSATSLSTLRSPPAQHFPLEDVLSDEWSCTVLWAYLYSSAVGRGHQHHQRLSFLIETTFRITPLYRKFAGIKDAPTLKQSELKTLEWRLKQLRRRFLLRNGAASHAANGVPVASPTVSDVKRELSQAINSLPDSELQMQGQVEKAVTLLLQLAREVEREFRVLGTRNYASFGDSVLYHDFITDGRRRDDIAALLRAARIPFYQKPNANAKTANLDTLILCREKPTTFFAEAGCQALALLIRPDGTIEFTDLVPSSNSTTSQSVLLQTIKPFLNPCASVHPAPSKPLAFNFTAGSGENVVYGAAMWLPVGQGNGLGTENSSGGLCVTSKFPLADSMRHFLRSLRQLIDTYQKSTQEEDAVTPFPVTGVVEDAVHGMSDYLFSRLHEPDDNDSLPAIDFQLGDLFDSLSLTHILRLFAFVLLEKKIVLVASSYTVLFNVSEALRVLLHPLVWSHLYVPILPIALKDCLHCPTPFIFGLHDSYVRRSQMPRPSADLVVVNLDRDSLTGGGEVILPPVRQSMLREELFRLCKPHLFSRDSIDSFETNSSPSGSFPTRAVRCLFRKHVREILTSLEPCVNRFEFNDQSVCVVDSINASQWPADAQRFCSTLLLTQAVSTYLATTTSTWM